jgi:hypothetical protein
MWSNKCLITLTSDHIIVNSWRSKQFVFCVTTDLYLFQERWCQTLFGVLLHSVHRVLPRPIRIDHLYIMTETERLSYWIYLYDNIKRICRYVFQLRLPSSSTARTCMWQRVRWSTWRASLRSQELNTYSGITKKKWVANDRKMCIFTVP